MPPCTRRASLASSLAKHSRPLHEPSKYAQPSALVPRGLRIEQAAQYSGLSPFYIEEEIRAGRLLSIGGPGSGVCAAHVILKEHLDKFLDDLAEAAEERRVTAKGKSLK